MYLWILLVVILVILILILIFWPRGQSQVIFYFRYPSAQAVQEGVFGTDPVISSTRLSDIYSDQNATQNVGYMQTQNDYITYPLNNQMINNKAFFVNFTDGDIFTLNSIDKYISDPPAKPPIFNFKNSYVLSSTNSYYVSKRFTIANVRDDIYRITINS